MSSVRMRSTVARATSCSPSAWRRASSHCTFRPGRMVSTDNRSGARGTGRMSSTVSRATNDAVPGSCCSHTVANNALGAPPWHAFGSHGPRHNGVGTTRSPSCSKSAPYCAMKSSCMAECYEKLVRSPRVQGSALEGRVALITGAASGQGRAAAQLFASEGASIVVVDLNDDGANETVEMIEKEGGEASAVHADVSRRDDCDDMVAAAI